MKVRRFLAHLLLIAASIVGKGDFQIRKIGRRKYLSKDNREGN